MTHNTQRIHKPPFTLNSITPKDTQITPVIKIFKENRYRVYVYPSIKYQYLRIGSRIDNYEVVDIKLLLDHTTLFVDIVVKDLTTAK